MRAGQGGSYSTGEFFLGRWPRRTAESVGVRLFDDAVCVRKLACEGCCAGEQAAREGRGGARVSKPPVKEGCTTRHPAGPGVKAVRAAVGVRAAAAGGGARRSRRCA